MALGLPDNSPIAEESRLLGDRWRLWFSWVHTTVIAARQSGVTADRPTALLWIGRTYFDTTLGIPVWVQSVNPAVWVDATGAPA